MLHNCFWRNSHVLKGQCSCLQRGSVSLSLPQRECGSRVSSSIHHPSGFIYFLFQVQSTGHGAMCVWPRCFDTCGFCSSQTHVLWISPLWLCPPHPCSVTLSHVLALCSSWPNPFSRLLPSAATTSSTLAGSGHCLISLGYFITLGSAVKSGPHLCSPGEVCLAGQGWDLCALRVSTNRDALSCLLPALRTEIKQQRRNKAR